MFTTSFTREEKMRVIELARELGVSATALYRELNTAPVSGNRVSIREDVAKQEIRSARRDYRDISKDVTARCEAALSATRKRREYKLSARINSALSDRGLMVSSGMGNRVTVSAVVDRRGTVEAVGTVEVIRLGVYRLRLTGCAAVQVTEGGLIAALFAVLPERIDTTPARFVSKLRIKSARTVTDKTGEAATPGMADGAEFSTIARPAARGTRGLSDAHKREITRQRVARHRAKQRELRAADGRTHALKRADVPTVGDTALTAPVIRPRDVAAADAVELADVRNSRELAKLQAEREAWKAANRELFPEAAEPEAAAEAVTAPVIVPPVPADTEPLTLF